MFSLICAWTNVYAHNRDAVCLRRHCTYHTVTVMHPKLFIRLLRFVIFIIQIIEWQRFTYWKMLHSHLISYNCLLCIYLISVFVVIICATYCEFKKTDHCQINTCFAGVIRPVWLHDMWHHNIDLWKSVSSRHLMKSYQLILAQRHVRLSLHSQLIAVRPWISNCIHCWGFNHQSSIPVV